MWILTKKKGTKSQRVLQLEPFQIFYLCILRLITWGSLHTKGIISSCSHVWKYAGCMDYWETSSYVLVRHKHGRELVVSRSKEFAIVTPGVQNVEFERNQCFRGRSRRAKRKERQQLLALDEGEVWRP